MRCIHLWMVATSPADAGGLRSRLSMHRTTPTTNDDDDDDSINGSKNRRWTRRTTSYTRQGWMLNWASHNPGKATDARCSHLMVVATLTPAMLRHDVFRRHCHSCHQHWNTFSLFRFLLQPHNMRATGLPRNGVREVW